MKLLILSSSFLCVFFGGCLVIMFAFAGSAQELFEIAMIEPTPIFLLANFVGDLAFLCIVATGARLHRAHKSQRAVLVYLILVALVWSVYDGAVEHKYAIAAQIGLLLVFRMWALYSANKSLRVRSSPGL